MNRYALTLAVGVIAASAVSSASAAVLISQDFEDRATFVPGTVINDSTGIGDAATVGGLWTSNSSSGQPLLTADPADAGN